MPLLPVRAQQVLGRQAVGPRAVRPQRLANARDEQVAVLPYGGGRAVRQALREGAVHLVRLVVRHLAVRAGNAVRVYGSSGRDSTLTAIRMTGNGGVCNDGGLTVVDQVLYRLSLEWS